MNKSIVSMPSKKYSQATKGSVDTAEENETSTNVKGRHTGQRKQSPRTTSPDATGNSSSKTTVSSNLHDKSSRTLKPEPEKNVSSSSSTPAVDKKKKGTGSPSSMFSRYRQQPLSDSSVSSDRENSENKVHFNNEQESPKTAPQPKVYKDNAYNRRLGRVGKPLGTAVHSRKTNTVSTKTYKDNALNRKLMRVGEPLGSLPCTRKCAVTKQIHEILEELDGGLLENFTVDYKCTASQSGNPENAASQSVAVVDEAYEQAVCQCNRKEAELSWRKKSEMPESKPKTLPKLLKYYEGKIIPFSDLKLHRRIGQGGFGEVFFAKWCESVVAVKRFKAASLLDKRLQEFAKEIMNFCKLDHPNIVKFIGACSEMPNICIVMEYMHMSLHDAIHLQKDVDFSDTEKTDVVKQTCEGVKYLHASRIAHCDLKTHNVLIDYVEGKLCEVKITDFGLSMVKVTTVSPSSSGEVRQNAGTPRYSAPEVLRGEMLSAKEMMMADIYSLSLVILEVLFEQEPFPMFNRKQLRENVGENGQEPEIPLEAPEINQRAWSIIERTWSFRAADRPDIAEVCDVLKQIKNIYCEEMPEDIVESVSKLQI